MRTERIHALILEVDVSRSAESLFKGVGTHKRSGAIVAVLVEHLIRNVNPSVHGVKLLLRAFAAEDVCKVVNRQRLLCCRIKRHHGLVWHIGLYIVPFCWYFVFAENKSFLFHVCLNFYRFLCFRAANVYQLFQFCNTIRIIFRKKPYFYI